MADTLLKGVSMRPSELQGKEVVGTGAKIVRSVSDIEIDPPMWKVTHLRIELADDAVETLGYKKPFLGRVEILLSVNAVKAVADVVSLTSPISELKNFIEPPKGAPV
jgi:sporulation protein YlmC with PRC-barrel domain